MAQELLTTFDQELREEALVPGVGGVFIIRIDGDVILDCGQQGFPELPEAKRLVRDRIAPDKDLGHSDRPAS